MYINKWKYYNHEHLYTFLFVVYPVNKLVFVNIMFVIKPYYTAVEGLRSVKVHKDIDYVCNCVKLSGKNMQNATFIWLWKTRYQVVSV